LYEDTIWSECSPNDVASAQLLTDTDYLLNIIRSQKGRNSTSVFIEDVLNENILDGDVTSNSSSSSSEDEDAKADEAAGNPSEDSDHGEESHNAVSPHQTSSSPPLESSQNSSALTSEKYTNTSDSGEPHRSWKIPVFIVVSLIVMIALAVLLVAGGQSQRYADYKYGGMPVVETGFHGRRPLDEIL
jgi:cobalamin biosynthesis Mg chelatase CobN